MSKAVGTHQVAEAQQRKNEILRNALKIGKSHVVGEAFDQELQEERKKARIEERNKERTLEVIHLVEIFFSFAFNFF